MNYGTIFKITHLIARLFGFPKYLVKLPESDDEAVVYVSRHHNLFGPLVILNSFPFMVHTWILQDFFDRKACYDHYANYTFVKRFGWNKYLAKLVALPISFIIPMLIKSTRGIPVYRGTREIFKTFQESV